MTSKNATTNFNGLVLLSNPHLYRIETFKRFQEIEIIIFDLLVMSFVVELLQGLCSRFPRSLCHDVMQAHCTWEYVVQWNKNTEVSDD